MKAEDVFTHIDNPGDLIYLRNPAFPVNMRLFHSNKSYKNLILKCCKMISTMALSSFEDYKKPHGMSGANLAIPFNIIGVVHNRNKKGEFVQILINPTLVDYSTSKVKSLTNCVSIRLKEPITIERPDIIVVEYFDLSGKKVKEMFERWDGALTIQHEIDHNNGILITDYL